jgi:hypothetical protein
MVATELIMRAWARTPMCVGDVVEVLNPLNQTDPAAGGTV